MRALPRTVLLLSALAVVAGCGVRERIDNLRDNTERSLPFKAKLSDLEDPRDFVVVVNTPDGPAALADMRESARFHATRYCLRTFGASDADWSIDPATGDWAVVRTEGSATVSGRCTAI